MYSVFIKSASTLLLLSYGILNYAYAADASQLNISNQLFDFAEENYPQFFSLSDEETFELDDYWARYYSNTDNYIGTLGEDVYVYGDVFNGLLFVGKISDYITTSAPTPTTPDQPAPTPQTPPIPTTPSPTTPIPTLPDPSPIQSWKIGGFLTELDCGRGFIAEEYQDTLTYDGNSYVFTALGIEISDFTTSEHPDPGLNAELIKFDITPLAGGAVTAEGDFLVIQDNGDIGAVISSIVTGDSTCTKQWAFSNIEN